jgi:hypothetical protein
MRTYTEREKWFIDRIGKIVYRNETSCKCVVCASVVENGVIISDANHAIYLSETECEYTADGWPMKYFDSKEEVTEFVNNLKDAG